MIVVVEVQLHKVKSAIRRGNACDGTMNEVMTRRAETAKVSNKTLSIRAKSRQGRQFHQTFLDEFQLGFQHLRQALRESLTTKMLVQNTCSQHDDANRREMWTNFPREDV